MNTRTSIAVTVLVAFSFSCFFTLNGCSANHADSPCTDDSECLNGTTCESGRCVPITIPDSSQPDVRDTSSDTDDVADADTYEWDIPFDGQPDTPLMDVEVDSIDTAGDSKNETTADVPPVCGDGVCEDSEACEEDCGSAERFGQYVANFWPDDVSDVEGLNPFASPQVEVELPGIGWSRVANGGESFAARGELEGLQWRISVPNMPGDVGCAEHMTLPPCRGQERVCELTWPPMVTRDLHEFSINDGSGSPQIIESEYECVFDFDLPVAAEVFCPTTSTVLRLDAEDGITNLFCVEPLYLSGSDELISQCRDQRTGEEFTEACGLSARSYPHEFPMWIVEQTIHATGVVRRFGLTL